MRKYIWMFFGVALIAVIILVVFVREKGEIKSPQARQTLSDDNLKVEVVYGRPSKRGREIFGGLVPFDAVWRTGANEATEFHTNKILDFNGQVLQAGDYSMWAMPGQSKWTIYFNSLIPEWGVDENGKVFRDAQNDVLAVEATPVSANDVTEMFTISTIKSDSAYQLVFDWDKTKVVIPFKMK